MAGAESNLALYNIDQEIVQIKHILIGLGFTPEMLKQSSNKLSGGWQMRLSLARCLYLEPDILLLDEPTNHLDLEAIIWLSDYLTRRKKIAVIVPHNIGFLNDLCTCILHLQYCKLEAYKGNYYKFRSQLDNKERELIHTYNTYEKKLKEIKRQKKIDIDTCIKKNYYRNLSELKIPYYRFRNSENIQISLFTLYSFGYGDHRILDDISFCLDMESKVTLVGSNGSGKSTLMKLITGEIKPEIGYVHLHDGVQIGYYSQCSNLPLDMTPVEYLTKYSGEKPEKIRSYLGRMNLESGAHIIAIRDLSGGQKARVSLVKLIFDNPHVLLLDEPSNHLDIETVESLIKCLKTFHGGIIIITHESELITQLETQIWFLNDKKLNRKIQSYEQYCELILN